MPITCWNCGYELVGLKVDDVCPECATPIWSSPPIDDLAKQAQSALIWGIVALALFFVCIGPLAALVAIPAITKSKAVHRSVAAGRVSESEVGGAKAGGIHGWITVCLSIASIAVYGVAALVALLGWI